MANSKLQPTNKTLQRNQRLILQRFGMALATYSVVILALYLVTKLGLGVMNGTQWATYIGIVAFGNGVFFVLLFYGFNRGFSDPALTREQILFSSVCTMLVLYYLPAARPIALLFYLPAFSFGMLRLTRRQHFVIVACMMGLYAALLSFEFFTDRQGFKIQYELFLFTLFGILLTWFAYFGGFVYNIRRKLQVQNEELQKAINEIETLKGIIPICANCKKVRNDEGYWTQVEMYIQSHSLAQFSHTICEECTKTLYGDESWFPKTKK